MTMHNFTEQEILSDNLLSQCMSEMLKAKKANPVK